MMAAGVTGFCFRAFLLLRHRRLRDAGQSVEFAENSDDRMAAAVAGHERRRRRDDPRGDAAEEVPQAARALLGEHHDVAGGAQLRDEVERAIHGVGLDVTIERSDERVQDAIKEAREGLESFRKQWMLWREAVMPSTF